MGFRNPILTVTADQVSAGAFGAVYSIAGRFTVGDTAHAHVVIGTDADGADGVRLYAADGVTPLIDLNIGAPMVAGSVVSGAVANATNAANAANAANATNAANAANAANATNATNASNLTGGAISGVNDISGRLVVGNPAAAHVVVGTDAAGADGVRLYAADGVTPLIDLNISGTPTITSAVVETSANPADARVVMDTNGLRAYDNTGSGQPTFDLDLSAGAADLTVTEVLLDDHAQVGPVGGIFHSGHGTDHILPVQGPSTTGGLAGPSVELHSGTDDGIIRQFVIVKSGNLELSGIGTRTTTITGGTASAPPANPVGYVGININGTDCVIPFYH